MRWWELTVTDMDRDLARLFRVVFVLALAWGIGLGLAAFIFGLLLGLLLL